VTVWTTSSPLVVGHRGGRGEGWPAENTLEAFERAHREGARAIELDVRTCDGGEVVVFHDVSLERMTHGRHLRRVCETGLGELRAIDLGGGARMPTLGDALRWARDRDVAVNVELKHDVPDRVTLARRTLGLVRDSRADVCLSSFDPALVAAALVLGPRLPRALLVHSGQPLWAGVLQEAVRPPLTGALHLERTQTRTQTDRRALARYGRRRLRCGVWTVNDEQEAVDLVGLGVQTIITDAPGLLLGALSRRR
jgi:glycerophosphoryl diester phosphodiesterase